MQQFAVLIRANVQLHPKIPLLPLAGLVHFRVSLLFLVLGRGRGGQQRGIHQCAFAHHQTPDGQIRVDSLEDPFAQVVRFEQTTEFQQGGGIRHAVGYQINPGKSPHRLAVVDGVLYGFVGQTIPLLEEIHPQHPLQPDRRASPFALRIEWLDHSQQGRPGNDLLHPRQKLLAAGNLLFYPQTQPGKNSSGGSCTKFIQTRIDRQ